MRAAQALLLFMCMQSQSTPTSDQHPCAPMFPTTVVRRLWWYRPDKSSEREGQQTGVFTNQFERLTPASRVHAARSARALPPCCRTFQWCRFLF